MQRDNQPLCIKEANDGGYEQVPAMAFMKVLSSWQFPQSMPPWRRGQKSQLRRQCQSQVSTPDLIHLLLHFFLLSFSFPENDKLVSFFIILYINYSILDENKIEKWTKKR